MMNQSAISLLAMFCFGALATPAFADACAPVVAAMVGAAKTPHTATITRFQDGKTVTSRMIQTNDEKYIQMDGKWRSMGISPADIDAIEAALKAADMTCGRIGAQHVDGRTTTIYTMHMVNKDTATDNRLWLGEDGLPLKVENDVDGVSYSSIIEYGHAEAPEGATPLPPR